MTLNNNSLLNIDIFTVLVRTASWRHIGYIFHLDGIDIHTFSSRIFIKTKFILHAHKCHSKWIFFQEPVKEFFVKELFSKLSTWPSKGHIFCTLR